VLSNGITPKMVGTLAVMAQLGSYVPATSAVMSLFDSVFTRMGARDDISKGQSTFLNELSQTSEILKRCAVLPLQTKSYPR
jgi:DNA mismatch repair ATPase MutS